jgi:tRNA 2-thiouridine synthesizing protein A
MTMPEPDLMIDATGLLCPEPLMLVRHNLMDLETGQVLKVIATDPSTTRDFRDFCRFLNHRLLHNEQTDDVYSYWIEKG